MPEETDADNVVIRPFEWRDADALWERMQDPDVLKGIPSLEKPPTKEESVEFFNKRLEDGGIILVAETGGEIAGSADLFPKKGFQKHVAEVGIALKKKFWGKGVAKALIKAIEKEAAKHGIKALFWDAAEFNERSKALAQKMGYTYAGRFRKHVFRDDKYYDRVFFEKWLG